MPYLSLSLSYNIMHGKSMCIREKGYFDSLFCLPLSSSSNYTIFPLGYSLTSSPLSVVYTMMVSLTFASIIARCLVFCTPFTLIIFHFLSLTLHYPLYIRSWCHFPSHQSLLVVYSFFHLSAYLYFLFFVSCSYSNIYFIRSRCRFYPVSSPLLFEVLSAMNAPSEKNI